MRASLASDVVAIQTVATLEEARLAAFAGVFGGIAVHADTVEALELGADVRALLPHLPCVLVTAAPSYEIFTRALSLGISGCVTGPVSPERLRQAVADARELHEGVRARAVRRQGAAESRRPEDYRRIFEGSPLLILVTRERHGRAVIVDGNPHAWSVLGYAREDLIGRPLADIYTAESRRLLESGGYDRALRGEFFAEERQLVTQDGRTIDTLLRAIPDESADGGRGTIAFFADMTEAKRSARALRESHAQHLALLDAIPDLVLRMALDGAVLDLHAPGAGLAAVPPGTPIAEAAAVLRLPSPLAPLLLGAVGRALEQRSPQVVECGPMPDTGQAYIARIVPSGTGEAVAILQDVTELRRTEAALREHEEALRQAQKMESIGLLAGGIAHDFNNILTSILGLSEMVMDSLSAHDPRKEDLAQVVMAARRAATLTGQLLAFSRQQVLQPQRIAVNDVVRSIASMVRRMVGEDVVLHLELLAAPDTIEADQSQLEQAVLNLVVNARAAMPAGGRLIIRTRFERAVPVGDTPLVVLEVEDTGVGMSAEVQGRVFEPFFTTKPIGQGTGLGLSMVYGFTRQSGGGVSVRSAPGAGTTFRLYFPQASGGDAPREPGVFREEPRLMFRSGTILLVEDEAEVRAVAARALRRVGLTVLEAADGQDALRVWRESRPRIDLLLADVVMPGMSGPALVRAVRAEAPTLPVILMSGYTDHPMLHGERMEPREMLVQKPFTPDELQRRVLGALPPDTER